MVYNDLFFPNGLFNSLSELASFYPFYIQIPASLIGLGRLGPSIKQDYKVGTIINPQSI